MKIGCVGNYLTGRKDMKILTRLEMHCGNKKRLLHFRFILMPFAIRDPIHHVMGFVAQGPNAQAHGASMFFPNGGFARIP